MTRKAITGKIVSTQNTAIILEILNLSVARKCLRRAVSFLPSYPTISYKTLEPFATFLVNRIVGVPRPLTLSIQTIQRHPYCPKYNILAFAYPPFTYTLTLRGKLYVNGLKVEIKKAIFIHPFLRVVLFFHKGP